MTPRDAAARLYDIVDSADAIAQYIEGRDVSSYRTDRMLRAAVEREFLTIGEALAQAIRVDPLIEEGISDARGIIAFRNRLAHGYDDVSDVLVYSVATTRLPRLRAEAAALLAKSR